MTIYVAIFRPKIEMRMEMFLSMWAEDPLAHFNLEAMF